MAAKTEASELIVSIDTFVGKVGGATIHVQ
jgi:hypothetical protein